MQQVEEQQVGFSNDIVREFFSFLDVKDIIRYRTISRDFNSMLLENSFVNLHFSRSARNKILVEEVLERNGPSSLRYLEMIDDNIINDDIYRGFRFDLDSGWLPVTSCNGLVCCIKKVENRIYEDIPRKWIHEKQFRKKMNIHRYLGGPSPLTKDRRLDDIQKGYQFRFVNPATREFSPVSALLLAKTANPLIGFGLVNGAYKLVVLLPAPAGAVLTRVFQVGSNSWRTVNQNFPGTPLLNVRDYTQNKFVKNGAFLNGCLNWLASSDNILSYFTFDLVAEIYTQKNLPRNANIKYPNLGVLNNRISFTCFLEGSMSFEIWSQEDIDGTWMCMASISFQDLSMSIREFQSSRVPLLLIDICDGDTLVLVRTCCRNNMVFYNFKEHAVVGSRNFAPGRIMWVDDSSFVESLVSPIQQ